MGTNQIVTSTQEQAVASWIDFLHQQRLYELAIKLTQQDINLEEALRILQNAKLDIANLIESNRGGETGAHGFIAERVQVAFENARSIILNQSPAYILIDDNGPADYLRNGVLIQAKFYNSLETTLEATKKHLGTYPKFLRDGGKYQIPKEQYTDLQKYLEMTPKEGGLLTNNTGRRAYVIAQELAKSTDIKPGDIEPAVATRSEVERNLVNNTIQKERKSIRETDQEQRDVYYEENKPTIQEGVRATAASAVIEGGFAFCLGVYRKLKSGKRLYEFTTEDWKDLGIDTLKGGGKGAVRGAVIYTLTNFTKTPAAVASAMVTASFGVISQARLLSNGQITTEDFIINSEIVCLDVTVSAVASVLGQMAIPIPVLGAVIGNAAGMFMYNIAKDHLSKENQNMMQSFNDDIQKQNEFLSSEYIEYVVMLDKEFAKFSSLAELAFDEDVNIAYSGSIALAEYVGCSEEQMLRTEADINAFFLS